MKHLLFILLILGITSCSFDNSYDYKLSSLKHRELIYKELPDSVRTLLHSVVGDTIDNELLFMNNGLLFTNPSDSSLYRYEVVFYKLAPWIPAYSKLIDTDKNIVYKMDINEDGPPYIIDSNSNKIVIPHGYYSIIDEGIYNVRYTEYELPIVILPHKQGFINIDFNTIKNTGYAQYFIYLILRIQVY